MKTVKQLSMLLMMVALSVCMASCSDDDDDPVQQVVEEETGIVGTWVHIDEGGSMTYSFNKNGAGSRTLVMIEKGNSISKTDNFKYTLDENAGIIKANIGSTIYTWTYMLTGNTLMLQDDLGSGYWVLERR